MVSRFWQGVCVKKQVEKQGSDYYLDTSSHDPCSLLALVTHDTQRAPLQADIAPPVALL